MEDKVINENKPTIDIAKHMLESGKAYSPKLLSAELGISVQRANGIMANIIAAHKYKFEYVTSNKRRLVRVLEIEGVEKRNKSTHQNLWDLALFA